MIKEQRLNPSETLFKQWKWKTAIWRLWASLCFSTVCIICLKFWFLLKSRIRSVTLRQWQNTGEQAEFEGGPSQRYLPWRSPGGTLAGFYQIFAPAVLLPPPPLVCKEGFGMEKPESSSSPRLPCSWTQTESPLCLDSTGWTPSLGAQTDENRRRGRAILVAVRNDETVSAPARVTGLLSSLPSCATKCLVCEF